MRRRSDIADAKPAIEQQGTGDKTPSARETLTRENRQKVFFSEPSGPTAKEELALWRAYLSDQLDELLFEREPTLGEIDERV